MRRWTLLAFAALLALPAVPYAVPWAVTTAAAQKATIRAPASVNVRPRVSVPTIRPVVPRPLVKRPKRVLPPNKEEVVKKTNEPTEVKHTTRRTPVDNTPNTPNTPLPTPRPAALAQNQFEPDVVIVSLPAGSNDALANAIAGDNNLTVLAQSELSLLNRKIARMHIDDGRPVAEVMTALLADGRLAGVQESFFFIANGAGAKTGLQYAADKLQLPQTRRLADGRGVRVAIIDTGIAASHEALRAAHIRTESVLTGKPVPGDHGTQIAGIIAASGKMIGIAPQARLISIAAFGRTEHGPARSTSFTILRAFDRAFKERAQVINMSFAGGADPMMLEALDALADNNIVLVAAAGNEGPGAPPAYPGAHARTIAVTATDARDALFARANRGDYVAVAAPGVDIIAPGADGGFLIGSGTSFAAPYVTGAAALILQRHPDMTASAVRARLVATAHDLGRKGPDPDFGAGLIDPQAALAGARVAGPAKRSKR